MNDLFQRRKVLLDRLVNKIVAVCKIKNLFLCSAFMETMDNLESSKSLTQFEMPYKFYLYQLPLPAKADFALLQSRPMYD